jgi:3',5'-cyclic AMP phosphodiesterase CpdA
VAGREQTARLLDGLGGLVFALGDLAYYQGTAEQFRTCYEPTWGRHKERTRPTPGNHEYESPGAVPYFSYFGENAGPFGRGYYSFDVGSWHIVSLNSNVDIGANSAQVGWLQQDLAASTKSCTLAFWHHPLFSSGQNGGSSSVRDVWRVLYDRGVDVVLNGHDHHYERFARQDPVGVRDETRGIRQFVIGTGGATLTPTRSRQPNSESIGTVWGVLLVTLDPGSFSWQFVPVAGQSFSDTGRDACH